MDSTTKKGCLAEARVIAEFIKTDFDIYPQYSGKGSFDIVIHKNGVLSRVEVRSTSQ